MKCLVKWLTIAAVAHAALAGPVARAVQPATPAHPLVFHSHNDYLRDTPVFEAFDHGVYSFESDLWYDAHSHALHVAHTALEIDSSKTFQSVTLDRVLSILHGHHRGYSAGDADKFVHAAQGHATSHPDWDSYYRHGFGGVRPLQLLVEIKSDNGKDAWPHVLSTLEPLRKRNWLTKLDGGKIHFGPVIVVGTGGSPMEQIAAAHSRDYFYDCPMGSLDKPAMVHGEKYAWNSLLCPIASTSVLDVAPPYVGLLPANDKQRAAFKASIEQVHRFNMTSRIYGVVDAPRDSRYNAYNMQAELGTDWLNLDIMSDAPKYS